MDELKNFTLPRLYTKLNLSDEQFKEWLTEIGLLHSRRTCICGSDMRLEKHQTYGRWVCRKRKDTHSRHTRKGFLVGTFFEKFHLTLKEVFEVNSNVLIFYFVKVELSLESYSSFEDFI